MLPKKFTLKTIPEYQHPYTKPSFMELSAEHLRRRESYMTHPASQTAARSLRYSIFSASREAAALNKAAFDIDVDLNTHLNTSLSDLARILFGDVVIQLFSNAHPYFTARELFEFASVPSQCKGTIDVPKYGIDVCWICGLLLDEKGYAMSNECEHVLPVAQAAYFLALYGPDYIKLLKEYTALINKGETPSEEMEKTKKMYDYMFKTEYAHSHAACNRKKNDMCGISGKLNIDSTGRRTPYAAVNEASIYKLLTDIYNDKTTLFTVVGPRIKEKYPTIKSFIDARLPVFVGKYTEICKFLNQCPTFEGTKFVRDKNCLYKFNALCIAGAGAAVEGMVERKKEQIAKYTKDANAFIGDREYLEFLANIYSKYQVLFIDIYNKLYTICNDNGQSFIDLYKLPIITRTESFQHIAHEYFRIASSLPQFIYLENIKNILNKNNYEMYVNEITNILIGIFLRERCNLLIGNESFKVLPLPMRKALDEQLLTPYTKSIGKVVGNSIISDLTKTHIYMGIASQYNDKFTYNIDNIITLKLKVVFPEPGPEEVNVEGGGKATPILHSSNYYTRRQRTNKLASRRRRQYYTPQQLGLTPQNLIKIQQLDRDKRAERRAAEREKKYNEQMLFGINAITTVITDNNVDIVDPNAASVFMEINHELNIAFAPKINSILAKGGKRSKCHIKTRKHRKVRK